jgi:hypothetical protein
MSASNKSQKGNKDSSQIFKKVVKNRCGANQPLEVVLTKEKSVGDYLRLFVGGPTGTSSELIVHRPIGLTDLDGDDWVLSSPTEIQFLVSRSKDPELSRLVETRSTWIQEQAVLGGLLEYSQTGDELFYPGTKLTRKSYLKSLKDRAKERHKDDKKFKFVLDAALAEENNSQAEAERAYRRFAADNAGDAEGKFPQTYRTCGGPMADMPQVAVKWMKNTPLPAIQSYLIKYGVTGPPPSPKTGVASKEAEIDVSEPLLTAKHKQWFFFPDATIPVHKVKAKKKLAELHSFLEVNGYPGYGVVITKLPADESEGP